MKSTCKWRSLTESEKKRVTSALRAKLFTNITWRGDTVEGDHKSHKTHHPKSFTDIVRGLGFYVPCGGIAGRAYCQVWAVEKTRGPAGCVPVGCGDTPV